jgi:hypothetical protein
MLRGRSRSVVRGLVSLSVIASVCVLLSAGTATAGSALAPLTSIHPAPIPSSGLKAQDSCSMSQYSNPKLPSLNRLNLRGFRVNLLSPVMWTCSITDGNGSGAAISLSSPSASPGPTHNSILLIASANVQDNGAMLAWEKSQCGGRTSHPRNEEVDYLLGGPHTKSMVVLVAVPRGVVTPWTGVPAVEPTVVVLASSATNEGAFDLVCSVGTTISALCVTDAQQFATAYRSQQ